MKIFELNYPKSEFSKFTTRENSDKVMSNYGFTKEGDGLFGSVYSHPKLSYVVKVFRSDDLCYKQFYELVKDDKNVYFPRFRGSLMRLSNELLGVRMEKLTMSPTGSINVSPGDLKRAIDRAMDIDTPMPEIMKDEYPDLQETIKYLRDSASHNCSGDLHEGNIMFRGITPVIIDPYY